MLYICGRRIKSGFPVCDFEVDKLPLKRYETFHLMFLLSHAHLEPFCSFFFFWPLQSSLNVDGRNRAGSMQSITEQFGYSYIMVLAGGLKNFYMS